MAFPPGKPGYQLIGPDGVGGRLGWRSTLFVGLFQPLFYLAIDIFDTLQSHAMADHGIETAGGFQSLRCIRVIFTSIAIV